MTTDIIQNEKKEGQYVTTTAGCTLLMKPVFAHTTANLFQNSKTGKSGKMSWKQLDSKEKKGAKETFLLISKLAAMAHGLL